MRCIPVSAVTKDGVGELRDDLVHLLPEGPLYFPLDQSTDMTTEDRVAEVIREKALHLTRDEVPHAIMVVVEEIDEKVVRAVLLVETESQKGILVGKKGAMVREIGSRARPEVERLVGHPVFLELVVKVRAKWRRDPRGRAARHVPLDRAASVTARRPRSGAGASSRLARVRQRHVSRSGCCCARTIQRISTSRGALAPLGTASVGDVDLAPRRPCDADRA